MQNDAMVYGLNNELGYKVEGDKRQKEAWSEVDELGWWWATILKLYQIIDKLKREEGAGRRGPGEWAM